MTTPKLIKRTYRISRDHDKKVKKLAKRKPKVSESAIIRALITQAL
jgi:hypothetical protein